MTRMNKAKVGFFGVAILLGIFLCNGLVRQIPDFKARSQAQRDIAAGKLHLTIQGRAPDPPVLESYTRLLWVRYGVTVSYLGCDVAPGSQSVEAYDDTVRSYLRSKYKRDVLSECWQAASRQSSRT